MLDKLKHFLIWLPKRWQTWWKISKGLRLFTNSWSKEVVDFLLLKIGPCGTSTWHSKTNWRFRSRKTLPETPSTNLQMSQIQLINLWGSSLTVAQSVWSVSTRCRSDTTEHKWLLFCFYIKKKQWIRSMHYWTWSSGSKSKKSRN